MVFVLISNVLHRTTGTGLIRLDYGSTQLLHIKCQRFLLKIRNRIFMSFTFLQRNTTTFIVHFCTDKRYGDESLNSLDIF